MNKVNKHWIQSLTGQTSLQNTLLSDLEARVADHPYLPLFHLLLTQKMKQENHPLYSQQLQKTALYFPNTHWLHFQLLELSKEPQEENLTILALERDNVATVENGALKAIIPVAAEPILPQTSSFDEEDKTLIVPPTEAISGPDKTHDLPDEDELPPLEEDEADQGNEKLVLQTNMKLAEMLQEQAADFKKPVAENIAASEPYYTIDYFASQGIRVEEQPVDQLDNKVRKFTDWLKKMKRIGPEPADLGTDAETEHMVEHIAASSNEVKEIVTEAMAQVLMKQGKTDKAIRLYEKLSFMNPDKSAYFASKIKELKGI